jgi:hypothetical protein
MSFISHDSTMNQIHTGAISMPNLILSATPHNISVSYNFTELNLTALNYNQLHSASITVINYHRLA